MCGRSCAICHSVVPRFPYMAVVTVEHHSSLWLEHRVGIALQGAIDELRLDVGNSRRGKPPRYALKTRTAGSQRNMVDDGYVWLVCRLCRDWNSEGKKFHDWVILVL